MTHPPRRLQWERSDDPFLEDVIVCRLAEKHGLYVSRFEGIEITDEFVIRAAGMMCERVDYARIRKAMKINGNVPGARLGPFEYKLRKLGGDKVV